MINFLLQLPHTYRYVFTCLDECFKNLASAHTCDYMLRNYFHVSLCQLDGTSRITQRRSGGQAGHIKCALQDVIVDCTDNSDVASIRLSTPVLSSWFTVEAVVNSAFFFEFARFVSPRECCGGCPNALNS